MNRLPITPAEAAVALEHRLAAHHPVDVGRTVAGHLRDRAAATPARTAMLGPDGPVTYAALAGRVAATQAFLAGQGVRPGDVVACTGPRGVDATTVLVALESLGAVYLPVDAGWPEQRLATVFGLAGAAHVLDHHPSGGAMNPAKAAATAGVAVLALPADLAPGDPGTLRVRTADPAEPRYVFFTSGTTGTPKGAVVEHRGMVNHLWSKILDAGLGADDVLALTAPLTFDIAIWQMVTPLLLGGTVAVVDEEDMAFPRTLLRRLRDTGVTTLELVPTMLAWLLDRRGRIGLPALTTVLSTGEELRPQLAGRLLAAVPGLRLLNAYGFTETADDVTHHRVRDVDLADERLPVGSAVINSALYVLVPHSDHDGDGWRAARPGERGELFVGGLPPGRGYLGDRRATEASFFTDPFDPASPTGRVYRSGDAVVVDGGVLRYLGRLDRQVKVAGVRMELGEIEARLGSHPAVGGCGVVVVGEGDARELVACFSAVGAVTADELREHLAAALPAAMVPRRWHELDAIPVSPNGKTDHQALAASALADTALTTVASARS